MAWVVGLGLGVGIGVELGVGDMVGLALGIGVGVPGGVAVAVAVPVAVGVGVGTVGGCAQYFPPELEVPLPSLCPPHTIISLPVQTAVWKARLPGAVAVLVAVQVSMLGLYLPPVRQ